MPRDERAYSITGLQLVAAGTKDYPRQRGSVEDLKIAVDAFVARSRREQSALVGHIRFFTRDTETGESYDADLSVTDGVLHLTVPARI